MATPPTLKRKRPTLLSTLDRTTSSRHTLSTIVPAFSSSYSAPLPSPQILIKSPPSVSLSVFHDTSDLEEKMHKIIQADQEKSKVDKSKQIRNKSYRDCVGRLKLIKGDIFAFPTQATQVHQKLQQSLKQPPSFEHGSLSSSALYYFAIQNQVLFYDFGRAVRTGTSLERCFIKQFQFPERVFQLKQINWTPPHLNQLKQKNTLLVSCPWNICFVIIQKISQGFIPTQTLSQSLRLTFLPYHLPLNCTKADHLTEGKQQLYYVDDCARVIKVSFQLNSTLGKWWGGNRHKTSLQSAGRGWSKSYFHVSHKQSILDSIKHYFRTISLGMKSFFKNNHQVLGLAYDKKRRLLFSLIDAYREETTRTNYSYSSSKMLTCWKHTDGKLTVFCSISQKELLTAKQNQNIFAHHIGKNNRLVKIQALDSSHHPHCNALIVLQSGIRLYLNIKQGEFEINFFEYSPSFDLKNNRQRKSQQYLRPVQLVHFKIQGCASLLTVRRDTQNHTFFIWKQNQLKENQICSQLKWGQSINQGAKGNSPDQSNIYPCSLSFASSSKNIFLQSLKGKSRKNLLADPDNIKYLNPMAAGIFSELSLFIHSTELYVEHFFVSRPIDIMFMAISAGVVQSQQLTSIFSGVQNIQLQCLLLQLLCDNQSVYLQDPCVLQCLNTYSKNSSENGSFKTFQSHRINFFRQYLSTNSHYSNIRDQKPQIVEKYIPSQLQEIAIVQLILGLCTPCKDSPLEQCRREIEEVTHCLLLYLSRVVRFIWTLQLSQIPSKAVCLVNLIDPLLKAIDSIFNKDYLITIRSRIELRPKDVMHKMIRFSGKGEEDNSEKQQLQKLEQLVDRTKDLITRIIQLIFLSTSAPLKLKKKFYSCISIKPEFFQEYIFQSLITHYQNPLQTLTTYQQLFPHFIGPNLQKCLKLYRQTLNLNNKETFKILQQHRNIPRYLLTHLNDHSQLRKDEVRQLGIKRQQKLKMKQLTGSKEAIQELSSKLVEECVDYSERQHLIVVMKSQLQLYLERNGVQDNFYRVSQRQIRQCSKCISIQVLLLQYYNCTREKDPYVVENLKFSLLKPQTLSRIIQVVKFTPLKIIFYYYFRETFDREVRVCPDKLFQSLFLQAFQDFNGQRIQGTTKDVNTWNWLQDGFSLIFGRVKQYIDLDILLQQLLQSLQKARMQYEKNNTTIPDTFDQLIIYLSKDGQKESLSQWILKNKFPIVAHMLMKSGFDQKQLQNKYLQVLNSLIYNFDKISPSQLSIVYNCWLNVWCLQIERGSKVKQFASKTKVLLKSLQSSNIVGKSQITSLKKLMLLIHVNEPVEQMLIDFE